MLCFLLLLKEETCDDGWGLQVFRSQDYNALLFAFKQVCAL
jgi:hypothetical protein